MRLFAALRSPSNCWCLVRTIEYLTHPRGEGGVQSHSEKTSQSLRKKSHPVTTPPPRGGVGQAPSEASHFFYEPNRGVIEKFSHFFAYFPMFLTSNEAHPPKFPQKFTIFFIFHQKNSKKLLIFLKKFSPAPLAPALATPPLGGGGLAQSQSPTPKKPVSHPPPGRGVRPRLKYSMLRILPATAYMRLQLKKSARVVARLETASKMAAPLKPHRIFANCR